jgi:hypothetical protein
MIKSYNNSLQIDLVDTPLLNQYSYQVDDSKIKSLGFTPKDDLCQEIYKTLTLLNNLRK